MLKELSKCNEAISNLKQHEEISKLQPQLSSITCSLVKISKTITLTHNVIKCILDPLTAAFDIVQCEILFLSTYAWQGEDRS